MTQDKAKNWRGELAKAANVDDLDAIMVNYFGGDFADVIMAIERVFAKINDPALRKLIDNGLKEELEQIKNEHARKARKEILKPVTKDEIDVPQEDNPQETRLYIYGKSQGEDVRYEIIEADQINASHLPNSGFDKNPNYSLENERLYHKEAASQEKVLNNALRLNPDFLLRDSVDANNGAPVIDHENNVLGGNSRIMSLQKAWETGGKKIEEYRNALLKRAAQLGFDKNKIKSMKRPILVRKIMTEYS